MSSHKTARRVRSYRFPFLASPHWLDLSNWLILRTDHDDDDYECHKPCTLLLSHNVTCLRCNSTTPPIEGQRMKQNWDSYELVPC